MDKYDVCCPFCGSARTNVVEIDVRRWAVVCDACSAIGPPAITVESATAKWLAATARVHAEESTAVSR